MNLGYDERKSLIRLVDEVHETKLDVFVRILCESVDYRHEFVVTEEETEPKHEGALNEKHNC